MYKLAKKLIDVPELDSVEVVLLLFGKYGDIQTFAFADSESPQNWQRLHYFLRKRCEKKVAKELNDVAYGYDDLGLANLNYPGLANLNYPRQHWFAKVWPSIRRAPLKDIFHGVLLATRSTHGESHPMNEWFSREHTSCLLCFTPLTSWKRMLPMEPGWKAPSSSWPVAIFYPSPLLQMTYVL
jgi:hypothetical protein